jgi:hypothetical protein
MLGPPDFVDRLGRQLHDVESVMHDLFGFIKFL